MGQVKGMMGLIKEMMGLKKRMLVMVAAGIIMVQFAQAQRMKDPVSFKLKNGLNVIIAENSGMGKVYASFKTEGGILNENFSALVGEIWSRSTLAGYRAVFEEGERAGMPKLSVAHGDGNVSAKAADFEAAFMAMSDVWQSFDASQDLLDVAPKSADVADITLETLKNYYSRQVVPEHTYITIAGDITVADAKMLVKKAFGYWAVRSDDVLSR